MFDKTLLRALKPLRSEDSSMCLADMERAATRRLAARLGHRRSGHSRDRHSHRSLAQEGQSSQAGETPEGGRSMPSTPTALSAKQSEAGDVAAERRKSGIYLDVSAPGGPTRRLGAQQGKKDDEHGVSVPASGEGEGGQQSSRPESVVFRRGSSALNGLDEAENEKIRAQHELQMLHTAVPDLLAKRQYEDAEKLVRFYLDRFPQVADLYVVFAEVYIQQQKYDRAIEMYWGALFCVPHNRSIVRYLRAAEETYLQQVTRIPHRFKSYLFDSAGIGYGSIPYTSEGRRGRDSSRTGISRRALSLLARDRERGEGDDAKSSVTASTTSTAAAGSASPAIPSVSNSRFCFRQVQRHGATQPSNSPGGVGRRSSLSPAPSSPPSRGSSPESGDESGLLKRQQSDGGAERLPYLVVRQGKQAACIAEVAFEPGQLVCRQLPYVSTPLLFEGGEIFTTCFHCLRERPVPDRGFSCPVSPHTCPFVFCSWDCLMRNVRVHALECELIPVFMAAAREANLSVASVLHVCRFLIKSGLDRQVLPPRRDTLYKVGEELQSYSESVRLGQPELYKQLNLLARRLEKEFPPSFYCYLTRRELIDIMLILNQYSPFIRSAGPAAAIQRRRHPDITVGMVFSPALANFHHSCVPTCCFSLDDDGYVSVRAICYIPVGGRLCVSMVEDLFLPSVARKGVDALPRVFGCGCIRCTDPTEGGRLVRGIRCVNCLRGYCSPFKSRALQKRLQAYGVGGAEVARKIRNLENVRRSMEGGRDGLTGEGGGGRSSQQGLFGDGLMNLFRFEEKRGRTSLHPGGGDGDGSDEDLDSGNGSHIIDELWQCNSCGDSSEYLSTHCERLETDAAYLVRKAERKLARGEKLRARKLFLEVIKRFNTLLHPNNHILYNAHVMAAGLLYSNPGQDVPQALVYVRRAVMAAEAVLPICHREKIFLYSRLAEITFAASIVEKLTNRGASPPPQFILEPMYTSLWNAVVCCGKESILALTARQQLRIYAAALDRATPPSLISYKLVTLNVFLDYYRKIFGRKTDSDEIIRGIVEHDPFKMAAAIARGGFHCPLSLEILSVFRDHHHLASGLSVMAIAASQTRVPLVKKLLEAGFDFLRGNELGVTPLLAMAAMPLLRTAGLSPTEEDALREEQLTRTSSSSSSSSSSLKKTGERSVGTAGIQRDLSDRLRGGQSPAGEGDRTDQDQAEIVRLFVRQCSRLDENSKYSKAKDELFKACTHSVLGRNGPLHYAAARGKKEVCRQLIRNGCSMRAQNAEGAIPLHLACASGDVETVRELLRAGSSSGREKRDISREGRQAARSGTNRQAGQEGSGNTGRAEADGRGAGEFSPSDGEGQSALFSLYINSKTDRGETPLMLAAYGLQTEVVRLLLHRGADVNVVGQREQMTVLHALAVGVCRNFDVQYEALDLREDQAATMVMGMNSRTLASNIYSKSPTYLHVTDFIDARIPVVSRLASDLLIFPQEILKRLKRANAIGEILISYCDRTAYTRQLKSGYSASQLLAHLWERLFLLRNEVLGQSELRLAALTDRERQDIEAGWKCAAQLAFRLVAMLKPDTVADGLERDIALVESAGHEDRTPRKEDLAERRRRQLEREAPWVIWEDRHQNEAKYNAKNVEAAVSDAASKTASGTLEGKKDGALSKKMGDTGASEVDAKKSEEGKQDGETCKEGAPSPAGVKKGLPPPPGGAKKGPPPPPGGKKGLPPPPGGKKGGEEGGKSTAASGGGDGAPSSTKTPPPPPGKKKGPPGIGKKGTPPPPPPKK